MTVTSNADLIAHFVARHRGRSYPEGVLDAAKQCLVDWFGVCLGALAEPAALCVHRTVAAWRSQGNARILLGGRSAPVAAALINGTLAHCLDYDDTHLESLLHGSAPTWAATLAVGTDRGSSERDLLSAFITGFEVGTRIGSNGIGEQLNSRGWHTTCVLGRFSSAVAAAVLLDLDQAQIKCALGLAATQVGGLTASVGTMAKPFHAGKTAADGVLAAELAAQGFKAPADILENDDGLIPTLFQDSAMRVGIAAFEDRWDITQNSFKPYPACQLTHASIDCARRLAEVIGDAEIRRVRAFVNPLATRLAGLTNASTSTEGKFSLAYTIALGLAGRQVTINDFGEQSLRNPHIVTLASRVETIACEEIARTAARLEITLASGRVLTEETLFHIGSIGNPMKWPELQTKFMSMAEPELGTFAADLLGILRDFDQPGSLRAAFALVDRLGPGEVNALRPVA